MRRGMWDLPGPGLEPVSPALAGRFLTTAPRVKSGLGFLKKIPWLSSASIPAEKMVAAPAMNLLFQLPSRKSSLTDPFGHKTV